MSRAADTVAAQDSRTDRRIFLIAAGFTGAMFGLGATAQSMFVLGMHPIVFDDTALHPAFEAIIRGSINVLSVAILCALASWWRVFDRRIADFLWISVCISVIAAVTRSVMQVAVGVHPFDDLRIAASDAAVVIPVSLTIIAVGSALVRLGRRAREAERERQRAAIRAAEALAALQQEELRVRRDVADALHGTMQQRLVLIEAELDSLVARIAAPEPLSTGARAEISQRITEVRTTIDGMRERELRELSVALYPEALDRGLLPAARALTARIPAAIPVAFSAEDFPAPDALDTGDRLLLVRVAEEGVSNALRHGRAERIALGLRIADGGYEVRVQHLGQAPEASSQLSGLDRLRRRLLDRDGELVLESEPDGATLRAWLPIPA